MSRRDTVYGKKLSTAQSLAANFSSSVHWNKDCARIGIWIDASSVTDNTGEFVIEIRANISNEDSTSDQSGWHELGISTPLVLADADAVLYTQVELPPCELRVSFDADGGTPDGVATIWLSSASVGGE